MHTKFARFVDPSLNANVVRRVNHVMDNPSPTDKAIRRLFPMTPQQKQNYFGPRRIGHRVYNHDWTEALIRGYIEGGLDGAKAALLHNVADIVSDVGQQGLGTNMRNLAEAGLDYVLTAHENKNTVKPIRRYNKRGWKY